MPFHPHDPSGLYGDAKFVRKPAGLIYADGREVASTVRCVHCGGHYVPRTGSGHRRGFCLCCDGPLCGGEACMKECVPFQKRLDDDEAGVRPLF